MKNKKVWLGVVVVIVLLAYLFWPKRSEKQYAQDLAKYIATVMNNDVNKDRGTAAGEDLVYIDDDHQMKITISAPMIPIPWLNSDTIDGKIELTGYESTYGQLKGDLELTVKAHMPENGAPISDYGIFTVTGFLINDKGEKIKTNYTFTVDNEQVERGKSRYKVSSVILVNGTIRRDDKEPYMFKAGKEIK